MLTSRPHVALCVSQAQSQHEERIKRENDREEAKRQLDDALKNMANGESTEQT
jgi:hypothetical protein